MFNLVKKLKNFISSNAVDHYGIICGILVHVQANAKTLNL